ncbi:MAG: glycosyltransferase [Butyrivibrio sp.]
MKILIYKWKAYNHYDLVQNLLRRGHNVDEIEGELLNFEEDPYFERKLRKKLHEGGYDIMMSVNFFPLVSDVCQSMGIRYVSWCCDSPISSMYNESIFNAVNTVFTFDKFNQLEFEEMGAPVYYLPLCTDCGRAAAVIDETKDYVADVSFVGSMYRKNSYDEVYDKLPEYYRGYFDAAIKLQMNVYGGYMLDDVLDEKAVSDLQKYFVIAKGAKSFSDLELIFSTTVLGFKIAQMERQAAIAELSPRCRVNVYTEEQEKFVLAHNMGTVDYWKEAPQVYNRSKINLNLTLRTIKTGIPLRVWDILGAGGFCLTNYQAELPLYFENGKDLVYFESRDEMLEKVSYYLAHDDERREIAENGRRKVMELHSYMNRLDRMAEIVNGL